MVVAGLAEHVGAVALVKDVLPNLHFQDKFLVIIFDRGTIKGTICDESNNYLPKNDLHGVIQQRSGFHS